MYFGKLVGIIHSHLYLLEVVREMVPLVEGNPPHEFLMNADFCLATGIW